MDDLTFSRNQPKNFGHKFIKDADNGIKFMSSIFIQVLKGSTEFPTIRKFRKVRKILENTDGSIFVGDAVMIIKLLMIYSFMINVLDNSDHLKSYFNGILQDRDIYIYLAPFELEGVNLIQHVIKFEL